MKYFVAVGAFLFLIVEAKADGNHAFSDIAHFPDFKGASVYTVLKEDAYANIQDMYIPDNHTIRVSPEVNEIIWHVQKLRIGQNATIDLAAANTKPQKAENGRSDMSQAPVCKTGGFGGDGSPGTTGRPGVSLNIDGLLVIRNSGSLWIKTDGAPGGDGGDGGRGGQGGGPGRSFIVFKCGPNPGGYGGPGGPGGPGGATSFVKLTLAPEVGKSPLRLDAHCSRVCGPSKRPDQASGPTTVINVFGNPGCGGEGGKRGEGGPGGETSEPFGPPGRPGDKGVDGACTGIVDP